MAGYAGLGEHGRAQSWVGGAHLVVSDCPTRAERTNVPFNSSFAAFAISLSLGFRDLNELVIDPLNNRVGGQVRSHPRAFSSAKHYNRNAVGRIPYLSMTPYPPSVLQPNPHNQPPLTLRGLRIRNFSLGSRQVVSRGRFSSVGKRGEKQIRTRK